MILSQQYEKIVRENKNESKGRKEVRRESTGVKELIKVKEWLQKAKNTQTRRRKGCGQSGEFLN